MNAQCLFGRIPEKNVHIMRIDKFQWFAPFSGIRWVSVLAIVCLSRRLHPIQFNSITRFGVQLALIIYLFINGQCRYSIFASDFGNRLAIDFPYWMQPKIITRPLYLNKIAKLINFNNELWFTFLRVCVCVRQYFCCGLRKTIQTLNKWANEHGLYYFILFFCLLFFCFDLSQSKCIFRIYFLFIYLFYLRICFTHKWMYNK